MSKLGRRILGWTLAAVALAIGVMGYLLSHESRCKDGPAAAAGPTSMKAVMRRCYGPPDVLTVEDIEVPVPADDQLLVKVRAASVNPADWHFVRGVPYIIRMDFGLGAPKEPRIGIDYAGTVVAVGRNVTAFRPGDEVFGARSGALAEYLAVLEKGSLARKPPNVSFEEAAAVNVAGLTALQTLRDRASVKAGQKVLINGASGGVGTFAIQIAKALGAEVTAVCSTRNVELVRSLGADHVVDYTQADFTRGNARYDVIMDNVANRGLLEMRRVLAPDGKLIIIGGGGIDANPWFGAFKAPMKAFFLSWFVDQELAMFISHNSAEDLATLADMMEEGQVKPVIDRTFPLAEVVDAMHYLETGRARGKVVITMP